LGFDGISSSVVEQSTGMLSMKGTAEAHRLEQRVSEKPKNALASGDSCPLPTSILMWEYECHDCKAKFHTPVPRGPKEERETSCPQCESADVQRLNTGDLLEPACGG
jgi:DNA-directed RNA polymerase subunit RPC12/RpoP